MQKKEIFFAALITLTVAGTYNALVINGESAISGDVKFAKRLDESLGVITPGRAIATVRAWKKIPARVKNPVIAKITQAPIPTEAETEKPEAAELTAVIQEDLNMTLMEVTHPKKWAKGLAKADFSGSLQATRGVIENLSINLPDGENVSISFSEMLGNVFEFDHNGETVNGMIYQVDQHNYMVTFSSGSLEGARFRFTQLLETDVVAQNEEGKDTSFHF